MKVNALAIAVTCSTANAEDILAYAKHWSGKYAPLSGMPSTAFTGRFSFTPYSGYLNADYKDGVISIAYSRNQVPLSRPVLLSRCNNLGSYIGTNAFNAKVNVTKQRCEVVQLRGPDEKLPLGLTYHDIFGLKFRGTQEDLRRLKRANKIDVEVDGLTATPTDGDFVSIKDPYDEAPTISYPYEVSGNGYTIFGSITEARFYLPGAKVPFVKMLAHPANDDFTEDP